MPESRQTVAGTVDYAVVLLEPQGNNMEASAISQGFCCIPESSYNEEPQSVELLTVGNYSDSAASRRSKEALRSRAPHKF